MRFNDREEPSADERLADDLEGIDRHLRRLVLPLWWAVALLAMLNVLLLLRVLGVGG